MAAPPRDARLVGAKAFPVLPSGNPFLTMARQE